MAEQSLQAGDLDRQLDILQWDAHRDSMGETARSQSPFARNVWTKKEDVTSETAGVEQVVTERPTAFGLTKFTIRYRAGIDKTMEIFCEGTLYNIVSISEVGRRQWTVIIAQSHD